VTFAVSGVVANAMGAPVEGAVVEAVGQYNCEDPGQYPPDTQPAPCVVDRVLGSDHTNGEGRFSISGLPNIYVRIDASKDGHTVSTGVYMSQDSTVSLVLP
jgi:hypothetical protein